MAEVLGFAEFRRFDSMGSRFSDQYDCTLHEPVPFEILCNNQQNFNPANSASVTSNVPNFASTTNISNPEANHSQPAASGSATSLPTTTEDSSEDLRRQNGIV
ncbi:hypothetical protein FRC08_005771 [Ceratobasidium sp. 394]|nr:hypothetical protein FRC08_005771 [Ceratobasidium sp. 394]